MTFAVLADIHGNSDALKAVLSDMERLGISDAVNLGDHFSGPLDAAGTADMLLPRAFHTIRGNHDRWLVETPVADHAASDRVAHDQLSAAHLEWLRTLPPTLAPFDGVFMCHGTPTSDTTYWLEHVESDGSVRSASLAEITSEAEGLEASLILCGHTHIPRMVRLRDGRIILNPGSVGCPGYDDDTPVYHQMQTGTPNASYAIVKNVGGDWLVTFRSVPYDTTAMVNRAKAHGRDEWARAIATGWVEV